MVSDLRSISAVVYRRLNKMFGFKGLGAVEMPAGCQHCGCKFAYPLFCDASPDFEVSRLPAGVAAKLKVKKNGFCCCCGLFQDFLRPNADELSVINFFGKDMSTSDPTYHSQDALLSGVRSFEQNHIKDRLVRWGAYFEGLDVKPKKILLLRHWFGHTANFLDDLFECEIFGVDMSNTCKRYVGAQYPQVKLLGGEINGHLKGEFLDYGPFDAIFSWHILPHACDVHKMLGQIHELLAPGGRLFMTHEVGSKPHNPFHMLHLGEGQLEMLLAKHFQEFEVIFGCNSASEDFIKQGSPRLAESDYVVRKVV